MAGHTKAQAATLFVQEGPRTPAFICYVSKQGGRPCAIDAHLIRTLRNGFLIHTVRIEGNCSKCYEKTLELSATKPDCCYGASMEWDGGNGHT